MMMALHERERKREGKSGEVPPTKSFLALSLSLALTGFVRERQELIDDPDDNPKRVRLCAP